MGNKFGDSMKAALNEALKTGNYEQLNTLVAETVSTALNEAGVTASKAWEQRNQARQQNAAAGQRTNADYQAREQAARQQREDVRNQARRQQEEIQRRRQERVVRNQQAQWQSRQAQNANLPVAQQVGNAVTVKKNGFVAGVLYTVFGGIANVPLFILSLIAVVAEWATTGGLLFFWLVSIFFICLGKNKIQLVNKAKRYVKLCGPKMYAEVEELASRVGVSAKKVERDLRRILRKGILPTAHLDKKGTHLMLNDVVYKQYTDAEKGRLLREKEEKEQAKLEGRKRKAIATAKEEQPEAEASKTELEQMIQEGQEYIERLHYMNDLIPGEVISAKLYRLEDLLKEIFRRLEKEPVHRSRMHKLMNYYLPTTMKLVEAYNEFDVVSSPGEEIISAKAEIEGTLDTINEAFVELLNGLFQSKVMDVTTDAQVLQTMLASEGLTKEMDISNLGKNERVNLQ